MRRHFDGEQGAPRDELLAVNGVSVHNNSSNNSSNILVEQVRDRRRRNRKLSALARLQTRLVPRQTKVRPKSQHGSSMLVYYIHAVSHVYCVL